jgi:hypothetical protein
MKHLSFFIFFLFAQIGFSENIQTISSINELQLDNLPANTLVLFDVDEVLITSEDNLLKPCVKDFKWWEKLQPEEIENCLSIMLKNTNYLLVDKNIPSFIDTLSNQKDVFVMGFTSCRTGSFGVIPSMEKWRLDQLKNVGIDFTPFFNEVFVFSELVEPQANPPIFKHGILFCGDFYSSQESTKGKLLGVFLDRMQWRPKRIIFIDDEKKNLEAVQRELKLRDIPFRGYHLQNRYPKIDEKIGQFQIEYLIKNQKWLSDKKAKEIIKLKKNS